MDTQKTVETFGRQSKAEQYPAVSIAGKPRWITNNKHRELIQTFATIRTAWFTLYSFGGGDFVNPITGAVHKNCDQHFCAKQIVRASKAMLKHMKKIGRTPIAGDNKALKSAWNPKCDAEWEARMKQRYSLYLTVGELYAVTDMIHAERQVNEDALKVSELVAG